MGSKMGTTPENFSNDSLRDPAHKTRLWNDLKVPLLWIFENYLSCSVTQLKVNENILQSFKSESAPCIKLLYLKRKSRLWIIETSCF